MECQIKWTGHQEGPSNMSFVATTGSGHTIVMDAAIDKENPSISGANTGARPMELLLAGAGGCSSFDVVMILKKGRHDVRGCDVQVKGQRAKEHPKVFTDIHLHYQITGKALNQAAVERAVLLSHEKFCSATLMLGKTALITHSIEIIEG